MEEALTLPKSITLIGAGAVGTSLAHALKLKRIPVALVVSRHGNSARILAKKIGGKKIFPLSKLQGELTGLIFLTVPDDEIPNVVKTLLKRQKDFSGSIIFHTSGALSSNELEPLRRRGAAVGSFHPLQSFSGRKAAGKEFRGTWISLEGDRKAVDVGKKLALALGAKSFTISVKDKTLYHIAAVFASNYLVTLLSVVDELAEQCRLPKKSLGTIFEPLIRQTLQNVLTTSPASALTGPIARNDVRTIRKHVSALSTPRNSYLVPLYATLGIATARLAQRKKKYAR